MKPSLSVLLLLLSWSTSSRRSPVLAAVLPPAGTPGAPSRAEQPLGRGLGCRGCGCVWRRGQPPGTWARASAAGSRAALRRLVLLCPLFPKEKQQWRWTGKLSREESTDRFSGVCCPDSNCLLIFPFSCLFSSFPQAMWLHFPALLAVVSMPEHGVRCWVTS